MKIKYSNQLKTPQIKYKKQNSEISMTDKRVIALTY